MNKLPANWRRYQVLIACQAEYEHDTTMHCPCYVPNIHGVGNSLCWQALLLGTTLATIVLKVTAEATRQCNLYACITSRFSDRKLERAAQVCDWCMNLICASQLDFTWQSTMTDCMLID